MNTSQRNSVIFGDQAKMYKYFQLQGRSKKKFQCPARIFLFVTPGLLYDAFLNQSVNQLPLLLP